MMARFLITHVNSFSNKGDAAIAAGIIKTLRRHDPDCDISVLSATPTEDAYYYSRLNVRTYERLFNTQGRKRTKSKKILTLIEFLLKALLFLIWTKIKFPFSEKTQSVLKLFSEADAVLVGGGGSYGGRKYNSMLIALFPIYFAKMLGKKVIIYAPSVEPFESRVVRTFTKWAFNKADIITVREHYSADVLKDIKIERPVYATADPAFLADCEPRETGIALLLKAGVPNTARLRIGMTIKNGEFTTDPNIITPYKAYVQAHVSTIERILRDKDAIVVLFTTSIQGQFTAHDDDRIISYKVRGMISEHLRDRIFVLQENYTPEETKAMIGTMDVFVATRTHSGIFAMSMNVPLLAISYEYKTNGILEMMGLGDRVLDINTLTADELISSLYKLVEEKDLVAKTIKERLPIVRQQALRNGELLMQLLNGTRSI